MTDRELLELAAKAAGWKLSFITVAGFPSIVLSAKVDTGKEIFGPWNPLDDDGDALRLAVKLGIGLRHRAKDSSTYPPCIRVMTDSFDTTTIVESDPCTATRLAITRAAAEIGKGMK